MSMDDCIETALRHNLDVQIDGFTIKKMQGG